MKYPDSIITNKMDKCFLCGSRVDIEIHHIMNGYANRKLSTKYGLIVPLCKHHHTGSEGVHSKPELAEQLKKIAQIRFNQSYPTKDWMSIFHKNYL